MNSLAIQKEQVRGKKQKMSPFKSQAQAGYFNANKDKMEKQGVNVGEWNKSSKGMKLPMKAPKKKTLGERLAR